MATLYFSNFISYYATQLFSSVALKGLFPTQLQGLRICCSLILNVLCLAISKTATLLSSGSLQDWFLALQRIFCTKTSELLSNLLFSFFHSIYHEILLSSMTQQNRKSPYSQCDKMFNLSYDKVNCRDHKFEITFYIYLISKN